MRRCRDVKEKKEAMLTILSLKVSEEGPVGNWVCESGEILTDGYLQSLP